jgi:hypothetical protein
MSVLDNLVLTDGTRLFKTALFLRTGSGDESFVAGACDTQRNVVTSDDLARFWLRFLGCRVTEEPRVSTHKFFEGTTNFINEYITDPVVKNDLYEHLQSELKSNKKNFSPKAFIEDYVPADYRKSFADHLQANKIPLKNFEKDLTDIETRLRRRAFHTQRGATVTVPADESEILEVTKYKLTVNDLLVKIDHK